MMTVLVVLIAAVVVFAAGEIVRTQCRRMIGRPVSVDAVATVPVRD